MSSLHLSVRAGAPAFSAIYGDFWAYHREAALDWSAFHQSPRYNGSLSVCRGLRENGLLRSQMESLARVPAPAGPLQGGVVEAPSFPFQHVPKQYRGPVQTQGPNGQAVASTTTAPNVPRGNNVAGLIMHAGQEFNNGMTSMAHHAARYIARDGDFAGVDTLVDVAGGRGYLLAEVLREQPHISTGILFDLESVYSTEAQAVATTLSEVFRYRERATEQSCTWATSTCPYPGGLFSIAPQTFTPSPSRCASAVVPAEAGDESGESLGGGDGARPPQHAPGSAANLRKLMEGMAPPSPLAQLGRKAASLLGSAKAAVGLGSGRGDEGRASDQQRPQSRPQLASKVPPLCPSTHVVTGSFFEAETIPAAHMYSLAALRHKLLEALAAPARLAQASSGTGALAPVPLRHHAVYTMMQILHDWNDVDAAKILRNTRTAMLKAPPMAAIAGHLCCGCHQQLPSEGCPTVQLELCSKTKAGAGAGAGAGELVRVPCPPLDVRYTSSLYILDRLLLPMPDPVLSQGTEQADLLMMNNFDNARERRVEDMARLLRTSGFRLKRVLPTRSAYSVIEAEPIPGEA